MSEEVTMKEYKEMRQRHRDLTAKLRGFGDTLRELGDTLIHSPTQATIRGQSYPASMDKGKQCDPAPLDAGAEGIANLVRELHELYQQMADAHRSLASKYGDSVTPPPSPT